MWILKILAVGVLSFFAMAAVQARPGTKTLHIGADAPGSRVVTPLAPDLGGWQLPRDTWQLPEIGTAEADMAVAALPLRADLQAGKPWAGRLRAGRLSAELVGAVTGRDARWTRVTLRVGTLAADGQGADVNLDGLRVGAGGDQGSPLATMPGLYNRAGIRLRHLRAGETLTVSCWLALPQEGRGDTALRGTEQAAWLTLSQGQEQALFRLPRR